MFQDDTDKVDYALSYLKGTALDCFESAILGPLKPQWHSVFDLFIEELKANFRTYDPVREAEAKLKGLHMHESHQATKYFIKFQQLATCVQCGNAALCHQAYNGLTKHIKDNMVHHAKPTTLAGLQNSSKLSMHDTGNEKENSPMNPKLLDLLETSLDRSLTLTSLTTSPAKVLPIPNRRTTILALPRARAQLPN